MLKLIAITSAVVALSACSGTSGTVAEDRPCYGTFGASDHACTSDWTGIDKVTEAPEGATTTTPYCRCPEYTACFNIGDGLVACALVAGE